ncbi:MAG: hypothetical protein LCH56_07580 [Proteobacteria bacterium]|nr:hypothetical protein [Pseudomonadota bacterium]
MSQPLRYVIELGGVAAGLVIQDKNRYRFFASDRTYARLEQRLFRSPDHAEQVCRRLRRTAHVNLGHQQ